MERIAKEILVITGSSRRFGPEIHALAESMRKSGKFVIDDSHFHILVEEKGRRQFIRQICDADRLLVYNKDGYIGYHTNLEIKLAEAIGVQVAYLFPQKATVEKGREAE